MRFNPFRPNGVVAPGMFLGRVHEIETVGKCLFQAKNGNPVHFLIQGERGIGKSSLCMLIDEHARGADIFSDGNVLSFLVVSVDLAEADDQLDIIQIIGRELRSVLETRDALKKKAKAFFDWALQWEVLGVKFRKEERQYDPRTVADELINNVATLCKTLGDDIDGILVLIDEADRPSQEAALGALCKMFTERLAVLIPPVVDLTLAGVAQRVEHA